VKNHCAGLNRRRTATHSPRITICFSDTFPETTSSMSVESYTDIMEYYNVIEFTKILLRF